MSLHIYVDAYVGHKANERARQFVLDEVGFRIKTVEEQRRTPSAAFFRAPV